MTEQTALQIQMCSITEEWFKGEGKSLMVLLTESQCCNTLPAFHHLIWFLGLLYKYL